MAMDLWIGGGGWKSEVIVSDALPSGIACVADVVVELLCRQASRDIDV